MKYEWKKNKKNRQSIRLVHLKQAEYFVNRGALDERN